MEQWALGVDWPELCTHTSLDEGDIVRMLRRTLDILSQIPHAPHTSEGLRQNAKRAQQLMDRFPISEVNEILLELDDEPEGDLAANPSALTTQEIGYSRQDQNWSTSTNPN